MKILFIKEKRSPTGIEGIGNYLVSVCLALKKLNIDYLVLYNSEDKLFQKMSENNINVKLIDFPRNSPKILFQFNKNKNFRKLIEKIVLDYEITHICIQWPYLLYFLSQKLGVPIIASWQGAFRINNRLPFFIWKEMFSPKKVIKTFYERFVGFNLDNANLVISPGIASKKTTNICFNTPNAKIIINPNGVIKPDLNEYRNLKLEFGFKITDKVILSVGRITKSKGAEDFCKVAELFKNRPEFKFIFLGPYRDKKYYDELLSKYGDIVKFTGLENNPNNFYKTADLFLFLSHREGGPLVLAEAMFFSLPLVGWDVIGVNEMIENNVNGSLCKFGDIRSVQESVLKILDNNETYINYSKMSLRQSSKYNIDSSVKRMVNIFKDVSV